MLVPSVFVVLVAVAGYNGASAQALGSTCTTASDCSRIAGSVCNGGVCACGTNAVPGPYNDKCLPRAEHDGVCEESIQCYYSEGTECLSGRCKCKADYTYNGRECIGSKGLGESCNGDPECKIPGDVKQELVWCYNKQCACRSGLQRSGDRCIIGGDCTSDEGCRDVQNSFCNTLAKSRFQCKCKDGYIAVANNTKCFPIAQSLGSGCEYHEQCNYKLGKSECIQFKCQCAAGVALNKDKTGCSSAVRNVVSVASLAVLCVFKFL